MDSKTPTLNPIVLFGGSGMLGKELIHVLKRQGFKVLAPSHTEVDLTDVGALMHFFRKVRPRVVINAAALIDVDKAERNPLLVRAINTIGAGNIVRALASCELHSTRFIHLSTNYVFGDGRAPYSEKDKPNPINVYGKTKAQGEALVARIAQKKNIPYYIIRTSWLYSQFKETFVDVVAKTLLKKKRFRASREYFGNPTSAADLAEALNKAFLIKKRQSGIFHLTNRSTSHREGVTRYDIALKVANTLGVPSQLIEAVSEDMFIVPRPKTAILKNTKLPPMPAWEKSLEKYILAKYKK